MVNLSTVNIVETPGKFITSKCCGTHRVSVATLNIVETHGKLIDSQMGENIDVYEQWRVQTVLCAECAV